MSRSRRARYTGHGAPRTQCYATTCPKTARYQGIRNARFYCSEHAADVAAIVPLREIDGLTEALRHHDVQVVA